VRVLHALVFRPQPGSGAATAPVWAGILAVLPVPKAPGTDDVQVLGTAVTKIEKHTIEPASGMAAIPAGCLDVACLRRKPRSILLSWVPDVCVEGGSRAGAQP